MLVLPDPGKKHMPSYLIATATNGFAPAHDGSYPPAHTGVAGGGGGVGGSDPLGALVSQGFASKSLVGVGASILRDKCVGLFDGSINSCIDHSVYLY
jgi:hypothetical protein